MSMANEDGWCKHFDKENRACSIYPDRPRFCRVETETFGSMYGVDPEDMDDFCAACCHEQISDVYGGERWVGSGCCGGGDGGGGGDGKPCVVVLFWFFSSLSS